MPIFHRRMESGLKVPVRYRQSVMQNNCWLIAEGNLEKKIQISTQKYRTPPKLKMKSKRIIVVLKCKKMFLFEKIDKLLFYVILYYHMLTVVKVSNKNTRTMPCCIYF